MQLLKMLDDKDYKDSDKLIERKAARSVILKDNKIALVKSLKNNYYKFPGGGIEKNEEKIDAVIRETQEETGLVLIKSSIEELGFVVEKHKGLFPNEKFFQTSYYFFAKAEDVIVPQNLDDYEAQENYKLEFIKPQDAVKINEKAYENSKNKVEIQFLIRENYILNLIKEMDCFGK